jgi:HEAT repeat protein
MNNFIKIGVLAVAVSVQFPIEAKRHPDFADEPTEKLVGYLDDSNERVRCWAAYFLGFRFQHPQSINVRPPFYDKSKIAPVAVPVPTNVVQKLFEKTQTDADLSVRLASFKALEGMSFRIDTIPLATQCLTNSMRRRREG